VTDLCRDGGQVKILQDILDYFPPITLNFKNILHLTSPPFPSRLPMTNPPTKKNTNPMRKQKKMKVKPPLPNTITKHKRRMRLVSRKVRESHISKESMKHGGQENMTEKQDYSHVPFPHLPRIVNLLMVANYVKVE
jgi:hypothetical protein